MTNIYIYGALEHLLCIVHNLSFHVLFLYCFKSLSLILACPFASAPVSHILALHHVHLAG